MEISKSIHDNWLVLSVQGRLDTMTAPQFDDFIAAEVSRDNAQIALDMSGISYLSSSGLRSILKLCKQQIAKGGGTALVAPTGMVQEVLEESGMDSILEIYDSVNYLE